jgi:hypothetical protein
LRRVKHLRHRFNAGHRRQHGGLAHGGTRCYCCGSLDRRCQCSRTLVNAPGDSPVRGSADQLCDSAMMGELFPHRSLRPLNMKGETRFAGRGAAGDRDFRNLVQNLGPR